MTKQKNIEEIMRDWHEKITSSDTLNISEVLSQGLGEHGIVLEHCLFEEIMVILCHINMTLFPNGSSTLMLPDHNEIVAWCAEILSNTQTSCFKVMDDHHLIALMQTCVSANNSVVVNRFLQENRDYYIHRTNEYVVYLTFPFLEGVLRKACSEYVDQKGVVIKGFSVQPIGMKKKIYDENDKCSNLFHLIVLLRDVVSDADLSNYLKIFEDNLKTVFEKTIEKNSSLKREAFIQNPYRAIFDWRNSSLHGSFPFNNVSFVVMTLGFLISLYLCKSTYEKAREDFNKIRSKNDVYQSYWAQYPPRRGFQLLKAENS